MKKFRQYLKQIPLLKILVISLRQLRNKCGWRKRIKLLETYFKDYYDFKRLPQNPNIPISTEYLFPCIYDKTETTPLDPVYFYQDAWCAKKIFENNPSHHFDIASQAHMIGIISQFVPTTMIDIRPITLSLPGLFFKKGDITNTGLDDGQVESLSSICVVEHIGLGRYGDNLDPFGTEKSINEMKRILKPGGNLYISVPVDNTNRIYFNAHRAFSREYILKLFTNMELVEEKYIYGNNMFDSYEKAKGFGTGLYHFRKPI